MANTYGAIDDDREKGFDGRYLEDKPLTKEQKIRKVILVAVPILLAVLLIGGAALFLARDFDNLYPSHGHPAQKEPSIRKQPTTTDYDTESTETTSTKTAASDESEKKSPSDVAAGCLAHEKCSGLIGDCCPTSGGTFLDCCN